MNHQKDRITPVTPTNINPLLRAADWDLEQLLHPVWGNYFSRVADDGCDFLASERATGLSALPCIATIERAGMTLPRWNTSIPK